jgi:hypothetical protein
MSAKVLHRAAPLGDVVEFGGAQGEQPGGFGVEVGRDQV